MFQFGKRFNILVGKASELVVPRQQTREELVKENWIIVLHWLRDNGLDWILKPVYAHTPTSASLSPSVPNWIPGSPNQQLFSASAQRSPIRDIFNDVGDDGEGKPYFIGVSLSKVVLGW
jgi:hypothetical protein